MQAPAILIFFYLISSLYYRAAAHSSGARMAAGRKPKLTEAEEMAIYEERFQARVRCRVRESKQTASICAPR